MGLFKTAAKVAVASSVHGRVQHRQQTKFAARQAPVTPAPAAQAAPAPAAASGASFNEKMDQLRQLGELRDSGVLSEAEFEVKKSMILNS